LDRIDIHVSMPPVEVAALVRRGGGEASAPVRARVVQARQLQRERAQRLGLRATLNAALPGADLERVAQLDAASRRLIEGAVGKLGLSARAFSKLLRVARTCADLDGEESIREGHVMEGIQGRILDRNGI
jgi:magnesium chelatase family protein